MGDLGGVLYNVRRVNNTLAPNTEENVVAVIAGETSKAECHIITLGQWTTDKLIRIREGSSYEGISNVEVARKRWSADNDTSDFDPDSTVLPIIIDGGGFNFKLISVQSVTAEPSSVVSHVNISEKVL